jgi:uncharacterized membrane protein YhaH (DUF805 family)
MNWIMLAYKRFGDFKGRSRRMEYWSFNLFFWVILVAIVGVMEVLGFGQIPGGDGDVHPIGMLTLGLWFFGNFIPLLALTVRRWHDLGQTGWLALVFGILSAIPLIGLLPALGNFVWFFFPGVPGENRWGPDPKGGNTNLPNAGPIT